MVNTRLNTLKYYEEGVAKLLCNWLLSVMRYRYPRKKNSSRVFGCDGMSNKIGVE